MTKISELAGFLEEIAPLHLQESYDNSGIICGDLTWDIRGVLCALDATEDIVKEAHQRGCNVVVSHHPIIFKGIKKIQYRHYVDKAIIYAIKNDIALYAIHTNLDNVLANGVNQKIASKLQLNELKILAPSGPDGQTGTGICGELSTAMDAGLFLDYLKEKLQTACVRHTRILSKPIKKVAITGGSGASWIGSAIAAGADAYITADVKYHEFFEANGQILICDVGHFESEQFTIELLAGLISEKFRNFAAHCANLNTNPIQYF
ncbi:MAG: Nif3-like dinuclear metal center hexameric protein [Saprospiraceae bacterium]|nr:Nif3-like dinuclear metal center hexameric protein [Saprospiraceae bacterium]